MIKVNVIEKDDWDFSPYKVAKKIAKTIAKLENIKKRHYVSIIMVDADEIHRINKEYRKIDSETDVISFASIDDIDNTIVEGGLPVELGDIFISTKHIVSQSVAYEHTALREFSFLVAHGIYHLLGYDHMMPEDEKIMFKKQEEVLQKLKITRG